MPKDRDGLLTFPALSDDRDGRSEKDDALFLRLLATRTVVISDTIDARLARNTINQLLLLDAEDPEADIRVFINSPGGSADSGFAIFDMIRFIRPTVKTICSGLVASAAAIILLSAGKEERFALPNARVLLHQPSMSFEGCASDIEITAREILRLKERANRIIAEATGVPFEQVVLDTNRDHWLDAEEALAYGVVSKIITRAEEVP